MPNGYYLVEMGVATLKLNTHTWREVIICGLAQASAQCHLVKTKMSPVPGFETLNIYISIIISAVPALNPEGII